jgi:hypothetical protein
VDQQAPAKFNPTDNLQLLQILQSQAMKPPQDLMKGIQIQQSGPQVLQQQPAAHQQIFEQPKWPQN